MAWVGVTNVPIHYIPVLEKEVLPSPMKVI
jgi:hypothetical protein